MGSVFCICVSPALHVQAVYVTHPHSHSEQTRLRPSLGILCSIYFLGSRDAAYINTEQSFKELGLWEAILYRVNNRGEQVTQHFESNSQFPAVRMIVIVWVVFLPWEGRDVTLHADSGPMAGGHMAHSLTCRNQWPLAEWRGLLASQEGTHGHFPRMSVTHGAHWTLSGGWPLVAVRSLIMGSYVTMTLSRLTGWLGAHCVSLVSGRASAEWLTLELRRPGPGCLGRSAALASGPVSWGAACGWQSWAAAWVRVQWPSRRQRGETGPVTTETPCTGAARDTRPPHQRPGHAGPVHACSPGLCNPVRRFI